MANYIKITHDKLQVEEITQKVTDPSTGAVSVFIGTTRDHFNGKKVLKLEYEAYVPMAEKQLNKLCDVIRSKWDVHNIAIHHRLGVVEVEGASVVIAVTSTHRKESLEAVHFAIDELKATVPIWKKEIYEDETTEWKENKECEWSGQAKKDVGPINPENVQITASKSEVERRINSFIERKRSEMDRMNVQEFCNRLTESENEYSCARTDSIVYRRKDSLSHLRKSQVVNTVGPGAAENVEKKIKVEDSEEDRSEIPVGLDERLNCLEDHLKLGPNKPVPKDIYARIKALEERVLFLEGISPEYFAETNKDVVVKKEDSQRSVEERNDYLNTSLSSINLRIQELQSSLKIKMEPSET